MQCSMCSEPEEFKKFNIKEYEFWRVQLHSNQCYLDRCIIILKHHLEDLFDISEEERDELFQIGKELRGAQIKAFSANMVNYYSLGNETRHLHLHVIPRYNKPREFTGVTFTDDRWATTLLPTIKISKSQTRCTQK